MLARWIAMLVTACALVSCATAPAGEHRLAVLGPCSTQAVGFWAPVVDFRRGDMRERECALRAIAAAGQRPARYEADATGHAFRAVREEVSQLHAFYNLRAQRQQTFLDIGAGITFVSAAAGLEGGLSVADRQAWGVAAFAPVALGQINAYEPTRELFHGGALALQLITTRYDRLDRALDALDTNAAAPTCEELERLVADINSDTNVARHDPDGLLIAEALRLHRDCLTLQHNAKMMKQTVAHGSRIRSLLAADYAASVLELDHALLAKDRDLRFTPAETLTAFLASPLRMADSLLTGDNAQSAVNSLKTQIAFTGMNQSLSPVRLPSLPSRIPDVSLASVVDDLDRSGPAARRAALFRHLVKMRTEANTLRQVQLQQDFNLVLAGEYALAAASDHLTFAFDPVTNTTTVVLGPRPAAPVAMGAAITGPGAAPPMTP